MNEPAQPAPVGKPLRYLSVCSGMEAASVAWHPLGWQPVGFSEIEPFPCAILKHRFPNIQNHGSLTEHHTWPIEQGAIDLLVGGTPCQSFSVAGLRKGLADPRGNLALTFLGLADRLKPRWIVWENVPGVLSSGGGRDFGSFLGALVELGYGFAYRVLDAQHFGVPQRRRRVFVVACLGDWRAPAEVLSLREGLRGYLEAGGKKRKGPAADAGSGVEASCPVVIDRAAFNQGVNAQFDPHIAESEVMDSLVARGPHAVGQPLPIDFRNNKIFDDPNISGTIQAKSSGGYSLNYTTGILQPFPFRKSKRAASTTDNETLVPADVTNTLNNFDLGDTRTTHAIVEPIAFSAKDNGADATVGISPTLRSQNSVEGNQNSSWSIAIVENHPTLNNFDLGDTRTTHAVVEPKVYENHPNDSRVTGPHEVCPTVVSRFGTGGGNVPFVNNEVQGVDLYNQTLTGDLHVPLRTAGGHGAPATLQAMAVRRLTPVECERLQGFPDNWSRIPWKGKPETECPDGPRYKACGNSMAVPVMRWIGERIAAVEASSHA